MHFWPQKNPVEDNMKPSEYLESFYNHYDEEGRLLSKHGSIEFLTTMHYIEK